MTLEGLYQSPDPAEVDGDDVLRNNPTVFQNLWAHGSHEAQVRRLRSEEKRKSHRKAAKDHSRIAESVAELAVTQTGKTSTAWCSGCFMKTDHRRVKGTRITTYLCDNCGAPTIPCAAPRCKNHANRGSGSVTGPRYCAEHRHDIPSFEKLTDGMASLDDYADWLTFEKRNAARITKVAALTLVGGAVAGPAALAAAPAVGGAVGAASGLSGAAATSSGLATLGFGSIASGGLGMAGGTAVVTATGTALGGVMGGVTATAYVSADKSFKIVKLRDGVGHPVVIASGFMTEGGDDWGTWRGLIDERFPKNPVYRVLWGSKELKALGLFAGPAVAQEYAQYVATGFARRASRSAGFAPLGVALAAMGFAKNPWSVARTRAGMTGAALAALLARTEEGPYILVGHSLGARVMATAARAMGKEAGPKRIAEMHLLGAAIGRKGEWRSLSESVDGTVYNYWSKNDNVLKFLYLAAEAGQRAVGRHGFASKFSNIKDRDKSRMVKGHSGYFEGVRLER
ncbi:hypothetical protein ASD30_19535 [Nocardioides sp. Root140]|nr:hypothetical protein ASD30_19535 [Nocardioides sp. Root140]